jgi:glycosyltransferase involved in cell wall biosynthesis
LILILKLNLIVFILLINLIILQKKEFLLHIYNEWKIYYKNETTLKLNKLRMEIKKYKYSKINIKGKKDYIKKRNPKVSLIITIYNQENFLKYAYFYIQKQELKDIEIIFVDDASSDNSSKLIYSLMKNDKRIIYIKNKTNKGAFHSRNEGILLSKGKYILIHDPDDLLLNNILIKSYEIAEYYNLDILQFYVIRGSFDKNKIWKRNKYKSGILYSEEVKNVFFFSVTRTLWDKLIKREIFVKSINSMSEEFRKEKYIVHSDDTIFWGIICSTNSYGFLEQIGYFYNYENPESIVHHYFDINMINLIFRSLFSTLKYYYFQTKENKLEKNYVCYKFFDEKIYKTHRNMTIYLTDGFDYIIDVLDKYINCCFFNEEQINKFIDFKKLIIKRKGIIKNKY